LAAAFGFRCPSLSRSRGFCIFSWPFSLGPLVVCLRT
jgi:hypothetical protein